MRSQPIQPLNPLSKSLRRSLIFRRSATIIVAVITASVAGMATLAGLPLNPGATALVAQSPDEHSETYVVTSLADDFVSPGTPTCGAVCTLRDAVRTAAETPGHDRIVFAAGLTGTIALVTVLTINSDVTIEGPGADLLALAIEGNDFNNRRVLNTSANVTLRGLTMQRTGTGRGGGINNSGNLRIESSTIKDASYSGAGGAILNGSAATLTLIDSVISNNHATTQGGGINNLTGAITVTRTVFDGNRATGAVNEGVAIRNNGGTMTIVDSRFAETQNAAAVANLAGGRTTITGSIFEDNFHGAIYNVGANSVVEVSDSQFLRNGNSAIINGESITLDPTAVVTVTDSIFRENRASGGGAIHNRQGAVVMVLSSRFEGNQATFAGGGAIMNERSARITVQDSTLDGNSVEEMALYGGAINNASGGIFVLERSTVSNNRADGVTSGIINKMNGCGGIYNNGTTTTGGAAAHITIRNSTISGNVALRDGGGICASTNSGAGTSHVEIIHSTVAYNHVLDPIADDEGGGGIFIANGDVTLTGVILAHNTRGNSNEPENLFRHPLLAGTITSQGYNLSDTAISGFGANDLGPTPAGLAPLAGNGGPTWTHALYKGSGAIDAANHPACPAGDQRGTSRPLDGDGNGSAICDIGAFESDAEIEEPAADNQMYLPMVQA